MRIEGRHAIVTGASSGIGRAIAIELARRGAALTLAARRLDRLESAAREIAERFPSAPAAVAVACDVSDPAQARSLIGGAVERVGDIDVLVNNAGVSVFGDAARTSVDDYTRVFAVNFYGALHCMRETLPFMLRRGSGLIVNVVTTAALHGVPYLAAYGASKAALAAMSQSYRAELAGTGVGVMLVYPGYTRTEIFEAEKRVGGARRPPGRYAPPESVARATVRGIEAGGRDVFLTARGRALNVLRGIAPFVVERAMRSIARELREEP
ncbi:MAG: SDR family NAD(P)-dependent oxidoreductase [Candidatus Eisenbacteria bacterium]|nr:SDR family NAD(P)-dependent oxidoreductase [Candidatus Eisenbacteria bacterium]